MTGKIPITGMLMGYYLICPRKAWLSQRGLWMEQESEAVMIGRLIDQSTYQRANKAIDLEAQLPDGSLLVGRVDWAELKEGILHETKKGRACEEAHIWQLRFYLWLLKRCEVLGPDGKPFTGMLNYPRLRKTIPVPFNAEDEKRLEKMTNQLKKLLSQDHPPERSQHQAFCKKCAFEELCHG